MPSKNYYHQAETHALKANELASDAREKLVLYKELQATITRWDDIMSNTYPAVWAVFFVIISIVEFLFSLDLYTDLLPTAPWIIPIGIIVISVFISHWLAMKIMPSLRNKEFSDKRNSPFYSAKTDDQILHEVNSNGTRNLIAGIISAVLITTFIYWLSSERVSRELAAGMRVNTFGVYDLLPVVFYVFEIIAGMLVLYLIRRITKGFKAHKLKKSFDSMVNGVANETKQAVSNFELAEENGFDLLRNTINKSIHIAFYRNKNCNPSDEESYIAEPEKESNCFVKFQFARADKQKALLATVHSYSEYNFAATRATDDSGFIHIPFSSFANDTIKKVIVEFSDGVNCEDSVIYQTGNDEPHRILFRE